MLNKIRFKSNKGFSLIELIVVMAIMAILVLLAAPKYLNYVKDAEVIAMEADIRLIEDIVERDQIEDPDGGWPVTDNEADLSDEAKDTIVDDYVNAVGGEDYPKTEDGEPDKDAIIDLSGAKPVDPSKIKDKIKNTKDNPSNYVIITEGPLKGKTYHKDGYEDSDGKYCNGLDSLATRKKDKTVKESRYVMASDDDFEWVEDEEGVGYFHYIGSGDYIIIPNVIQETPMTSYYRMFHRYSGDKLKGVASYNSNITDMSFMFNMCMELTSLEVNKIDTSNVTDMSHMFNGCFELISLDISNFDTSNVTDMSGMLRYLKRLTSLDLSNFDTSKVVNMSDLFDNCTGLTSLDISNFDTSNVTDMGGMFSKCSGLTSLDVSDLDTSNVTDMSSMFSGCKLTSLDLSGFDTSKVTDMRYMFNNSNSLTSLDLSSFDTSNLFRINGMFENCQDLTLLDLSSFDTSKITFDFENNVFKGSTKLTTVYTKSQADSTRLSGTTNIPSSINFIVKN